MSVVEGVLEVLSWIALGFFALQALLYIWFTFVAWRRLAAFRRARAYAPLDEIFASPFAPNVSVLLPAYNEEAGIVASTTSLLDLRYPRHEVIVINDGSTDGTLERLREAFDLVPVREALRSRIPSTPIQAAYVSRRRRNLWVLDKPNGGKADALNAGINAASHPYYCAVDADAILEQDSLLRIVKPVVDDPDLLVAAAGIVRLANGASIADGRILDFRLPTNPLAIMQVVEYFRAFLIGRIGWDRVGGLVIISGAFGLFSRAVVEEVGGYAHGTVGEDVELVVRLHAHLRGRGEPYRVSFVPDPTCWTEAPEDLRTLGTQRRRWERGLGETLWRHRRMIGNPRYGVIGLLALPYFLIFEFFGAFLELTGIFIVALALILDAVSLPFMVAYLVVSMLIWILLSFSAIMLEEYAIRRYRRGTDIAKLVVASVFESIGYRQLNSFWRCLAMVDLARGRKDWGRMPRRGLERAAEAPPPKIRA
ncbi:MAG TPA: glycosyltransferase [Solirubrobacteraceae bacterium]|nr:glycosyltransferase [Solirubrobacteraceae bacterium]